MEEVLKASSYKNRSDNNRVRVFFKVGHTLSVHFFVDTSPEEVFWGLKGSVNQVPL